MPKSALAIGEDQEASVSQLAREAIPNAHRRGATVADEAVLIRRAQQGDVRAFNALVTEHEHVAFNLAYRLLGDREQAADVTQEAFLSAYGAIGRFHEGAFRAWLMRIVANACYDVLRARQRRRETSLDALLDDPEHPHTFEDPSPAVEDRAVRSDLMARVQAGLLTLPIEQRTTIVLADVQGFSHDEIARITRVEPGTVKSRLSRGRARLREYLRQQGVLSPSG